MTYLPEIREESSSDFIVPTSLCALLFLTVTPGVTNLTSPNNGYKLVPSCFLERLWPSLYNLYLSCTHEASKCNHKLEAYHMTPP